MALTHTIIEVRPELGKYLALIDFLDTQTGKVYNRRYQCKAEPDATRLTELAAMGITRIHEELDYEANDMNLSSDEDRLLEYYRNIKRDIILRVHQFPGATAQQAKDYIAVEYPDSPFDFDELYSIWIGMIDVSTWAEFKTWVIDHKFRDID